MKTSRRTRDPDQIYNTHFVVKELRNAAEEYGPVENVTIIKNHQTNKSKGCGFVKFVFREDAMDAFNVRNSCNI